MAHEQTQPPWGRPSAIPNGCDWPSLMARDGDALEAHYRRSRPTPAFSTANRPAPPLGRNKVSLDLFWLKDERLEDAANLADPDLSLPTEALMPTAARCAQATIAPPSPARITPSRQRARGR